LAISVRPAEEVPQARRQQRVPGPRERHRPRVKESSLEKLRVTLCVAATGITLRNPPRRRNRVRETKRGGQTPFMVRVVLFAINFYFSYIWLHSGLSGEWR